MEKISFIGLVSSFYFACWQQLGKVANPITGKIEKSLEQAKHSIDLLIMLREKTEGNLNDDEKKVLDEAVSNLQMNYVDETKKPEETEKKEEKKDEPKSAKS